MINALTSVQGSFQPLSCSRPIRCQISTCSKNIVKFSHHMCMAMNYTCVHIPLSVSVSVFFSLMMFTTSS